MFYNYTVITVEMKAKYAFLKTSDTEFIGGYLLLEKSWHLQFATEINGCYLQCELSMIPASILSSDGWAWSL